MIWNIDNGLRPNGNHAQIALWEPGKICFSWSSRLVAKTLGSGGAEDTVCVWEKHRERCVVGVHVQRKHFVWWIKANKTRGLDYNKNLTHDVYMLKGHCTLYSEVYPEITQHSLCTTSILHKCWLEAEYTISHIPNLNKSHLFNIILSSRLCS